ncbi:MAG: RHS repeat-associated core domain-containing protein [Alphaproteobacteria bacterium]
MSNDAGVMAEGPYTYDAYGQGPTSAGVPFKFTGRRLDPETGLYYYRARYYSASLGRFLQTDPVGYADQMNLYGYVYGDPVNFVDPFGRNGQRAHAWAKKRIGSTDYQYRDPHPKVLGGRGAIFGGRWTPKCNVFVADALEKGGDPVLSVNGEKRAPVAREWGDPTSRIEGYRPLTPGEELKPGDVVSDGTHVGLYAPQDDGADATISAPTLMPQVEGPSGDAVTQNDWGFREENQDRKKVTVWRCVCDDPPPPPVSKKPEAR